MQGEKKYVDIIQNVGLLHVFSTSETLWPLWPATHNGPIELLQPCPAA